MAIPTSAARSAGASFTPSPVTATTSRLALKRRDHAQLLIGRHARTDDLRCVERELDLDVSDIRRRSSPVRRRGAALVTRPISRAIASAVCG